MIALIVLIFAVLCVAVACFLTAGIVRLLVPRRPPVLKLLVVFLSFPAFLVLPFADEIIGRSQFRKLCDREAKVWVSPNAKKIRAARRVGPDFVERSEFVIPVREQPITYIDAETGAPFYRAKAFHTPGGFIMRHGLNMGSSSECWPERWTAVQNGIDIDELLKRGKDLPVVHEK